MLVHRRVGWRTARMRCDGNMEGDLLLQFVGRAMGLGMLLGVRNNAYADLPIAKRTDALSAPKFW